MTANLVTLPFQVVRTLRDTVAAIVQQPVRLSLLAFLCAGLPLLLLDLLVSLIAPSLEPSGGRAIFADLPRFVLAIPAIVLTYLPSFISAAVLQTAINHQLSEPSISLEKTAKQVLKHVWPMTGLFAVMSLIVAIGWMALLIPGLIAFVCLFPAPGALILSAFQSGEPCQGVSNSRKITG